jgi:hypothetical protein
MTQIKSAVKTTEPGLVQRSFLKHFNKIKVKAESLMELELW